MGCSHTKTMKKVAPVIIEKYYMRLVNYFHTKKHVCEITSIHSKIVGYVKYLMKQFKEAPGEVPPSSYRRRRENCNCEVSSLDQAIIDIDSDSKKMLKLLNFGNLSNLQVIQSTVGVSFKIPHGAI
uniref:40S ribosomal protein S17 n=1 Tax=Loxodonta africana TaxID=9785 RepID=G3U6S6_LOXAF